MPKAGRLVKGPGTSFYSTDLIKTMDKSTYLGFLILCTCLSCGKDQINEVPSFKIPYVLNDTIPNTCNLVIAHSIDDSWPQFIRKDKFVDTLDLSSAMDSNFTNDFLYENYFDALDSLSLDGLELYPDYPTSIPVKLYDFESGSSCYYPVYIVNQTPKNKIFMGKDSYVFAIQEAQDGEGRWRPIEHCCFDFCGNGGWGIIIHPHEFITILFKKYEGKYQTKMRVRLENRDVIYVSKAFDGIVNTPQFYFDTSRGNFIKSHLKLSPESLQAFFYGSIPFEYADREEE